MRTQIPSDRYYDQAFAAREWERMWRRVWMLVGHASDVAADGQWFVHELGHESVLVVRDGERVRAFHNVCPHRGAILCQGERGHAAGGRFTCPYHDWQFGLDGALKKAPDAGAIPPEFGHLSELRCEVQAGWVWVSLAADAVPLQEFLGPVLPRLQVYHAERYRRVGHLTLEIACNWKASADVSNEWYHLRAVHPELLGWCDVDAVAAEELERHSHIRVPFGVPSRDAGPWPSPELLEYARGFGIDPSRVASPDALRSELIAATRAIEHREQLQLGELTDEQLVDKHQYMLFPHVQLNHFTAFHLDLYRHRPFAGDPERMIFDWERFQRVRPGHEEPLVRRKGKPGDFDVGRVMQADLDLLPRVQRGLHAASMRTFLTTAREWTIAHAHSVLERYLGEFEGEAATWQP